MPSTSALGPCTWCGAPAVTDVSYIRADRPAPGQVLDNLGHTGRRRQGLTDLGAVLAGALGAIVVRRACPTHLPSLIAELKTRMGVE